MQIVNLRIETDGWPIHEYRIADRHLEFRTLDSGQSYDQRNTWRRLTSNELNLHFRLNTVVARWFLQKSHELEVEMAEQEFERAA